MVYRKWKQPSGTPTYNSWKSMKQRCSPNNKRAYKDYYGRGIRICESWINDYDKFYEDMGARPEGMSLDRIDNDGNYEPSNCRWASIKVQENNRRNNRNITHNGKTQSVTQWAEELGIKISTLFRRLDTHKMLPELALTKKVKPHGTAYQYYYHNCRCKLCINAVKKKNKKIVARAKQRKLEQNNFIKPPDKRKFPYRQWSHGTGTGYSDHKCRCNLCREYNRIKSAKYYAKIKSKRLKSDE